VATLVLATLTALSAAGCGEAGGVAEGATVSVYAVAPACAGAKRVLGRHGARAGEARVRLICLSDSERGRAWTLAAVGANARRATQDSTSVAYIADRDQTADEFSRSILEEAGIAQLSGEPGATAMHKLLTAIEDAGSSGNLRESVEKSLGSD
jgi:branched-chain amino acid transport system substrate-binding protein